MPAPKNDPARSRGRNTRPNGVVVLPAAGYQGPIPPWPLGDLPDSDDSFEIGARERELWSDLWRSPQAAVWADTNAAGAVGRYVRLRVASERKPSDASIANAVGAQEDRIGLNPKSMRLMLWMVDPDELAALRKEATSGAPGVVRSLRAAERLQSAWGDSSGTPGPVEAS